MTSISKSPARCQATLLQSGHPCRRNTVPNAVYCPTHQFLLEPLGGDGSALSLHAELRLIRLELHKLVATGAPTTHVLAALRTLVLIARTQARLDTFLSHRNGRG